jgi:hypothetical protein
MIFHAAPLIGGRTMTVRPREHPVNVQWWLSVGCNRFFTRGLRRRNARLWFRVFLNDRIQSGYIDYRMASFR